jgi:ketosteroid isomerase-like protein
MKSYLTALAAAVALLAPGVAQAADATLNAPIQAFTAAFNKGDLKAAEATQTADVIIIDEPAPFRWIGPGAFQHWVADLDKDEKARGRSEGRVALGAVKREEVAGDAAYVIVEADYIFKEKGVPKHEPSQWTFALRRVAGAWKISGWTWSGPRAQPHK